MESKTTERRRFERSPIELPIAYSHMNAFFYDYINNISLGGTFIKTVNFLPVGTRFRFIIRLAASSEEMTLDAEVVWIREQDQPYRDTILPRGMGIKFIFQSEEERQKFQAKVEKLIRDKLGDRIAAKLLNKNLE